jgi:hypothetical protein
MTSPAGGRRLPGLSGAVGWTLVILPSLVVLASIPFDLLPWLRGPAPYPPEWQWGYRPEGPARPLVAGSACAVAVIALLVASGTAWARRRPRAMAGWLVAGSVALGWILPIALLARERAEPMATLLARARSPSFTSYHTVAISEAAREPLSFLRRHAELLPVFARTAKHAATHPPGPVLFYRGMIGLCEASPGLTGALLRAASVPADHLPSAEARTARAGALLGDLVLLFLGALTSWPLARLAEHLGLPPLAAARAALLWALLPGCDLMTPQFDQALALPAAASTLMLLEAAGSTSGWVLAARAGLAGLSGGVALFVSYGAAAFLAIGGLAALAAVTPPARSTDRLARLVAPAALAAVVAGLAAFGLPALLGHQPLRAMRTALAIHREIYTAPRSYPLWLAYDLLDLAVFLGLPVAVLALWHAVGSLRRALSGTPLDAAERFALAAVAGVLALDLLGVTRGEVGRIWIPLMPFLLVGALTGEEGRGVGPSIVLGVLVAACTLAIAAYWTV